MVARGANLEVMDNTRRGPGTCVEALPCSPPLCRGGTLLHLAAGKGHAAVVTRLVELRATVDPRDIPAGLAADAELKSVIS